MRIEITRELKIKLLQALKNGFIETMDFTELEACYNADVESRNARVLETLTDEEKELLLNIARRDLDWIR
jgi:hypothetical protein